MQIYLAGKFTAKERLCVVRERLRDIGFKVEGHWLDLGYNDYTATLEQSLYEADTDLIEVGQSDVIALDTLDESNTGGREVELGYAIASGMRFFRVGPVRNIFHNLADEAYETWEDFYRTHTRYTLVTDGLDNRIEMPHLDVLPAGFFDKEV